MSSFMMSVAIGRLPITVQVKECRSFCTETSLSSSGVMFSNPGTVLLRRSTSSWVSLTCTPAFEPPTCSLVLSGKDADQPGAPLREDGLDGAAESGAVGKQQHHRGDAPGHAHHGDHGAPPVVDHRLVGLLQ